MTRPAASTGVESVPWATFRRDFNRGWAGGEHISIIGQTGAGKSYLIAHGLMPLLVKDRVLIIDVKGDDPTWRGIGETVRQIPRFRFHKADSREWYRLIVPDDVTAAKEQVRRALDRVYAEGRWVVVIDETRALTDPKAPNLGLQPWVDRMWLRGRSRGITVVAGTQAPRWVPSSFYDQPSHVFLLRVRDSEAQKRLREIGGYGRDLDPVMAALPKRDFIYVGDAGDTVRRSRVTG